MLIDRPFAGASSVPPSSSSSSSLATRLRSASSSSNDHRRSLELVQRPESWSDGVHADVVAHPSHWGVHPPRAAILAVGIKGALRGVRVGAPVVAAAVVRRRAGVGAARGGVGQEEEGEQST